MADSAATNGKTASAVALSDISIAFRLAGGGGYTAVERATLNVADGEFVAIVGPTGCGKSTLLNIAAGLLAPSGGAVDIFGSPLAALNRQAGYLFQADALFPWKTALENVAIGLETAGTPVSEARPRAQEWLTRVGLAAFGDRFPHMLLGGQRKRVGLAQVLIRDPKILLMDEPFGPLDAQTRQIMGNLLLDLWSADRKAVLFVTHDLEEAIALSDRVVIAALKNTLPMYSETGRMDPKGAAAVLAVFAKSSPDVAKANIDLSKTYTNEFVDVANKKMGMK